MTTDFKLSLYQPTFRQQPDKQQNLPRFRNLVRSFEHSLEKSLTKDDVQVVLAPFHELALDHEFWASPLDGLAILAARDQFDIYQLPRTVPELAVIADIFHIKPLLRIRQSAYRFQVLGVNRKEICLFEGDRDGLAEISLAPGVARTIVEALGDDATEPHITIARLEGGKAGVTMRHTQRTHKEDIALDTERFFRVVDHAITEKHSKQSGLPLILAALPEHEALFRSITHNPYLTGIGIDAHPTSIDHHEFENRAWTRVQPFIAKRLERIIGDFFEAEGKGKGSSDLSAISLAAMEGRIHTLMVQDEAPAELNDLLDHLAQLALRKGAEVLVMPAKDLPSETGAAAIYRF